MTLSTRFAALAAVLVSVSIPLRASAGFPATMSLSLTRFTQPAGPPTYEIQVFGSGGGSSGSLIMPDGSAFPSLGRISNLLEADAFAKLIGQWTINVTPIGFPPKPESHTFNISPFSVADIYSIAPAITSPTPDSIVPAQFPLTFEWPAGATPPTGRATRASYSSTVIDSVDTNPTAGANTATISVNFKPGHTAGALTLYVGASQLLNSYVSTPVPSAPDTFFTYSARLSYSNLSTPLRVAAAIPEPGSLGLIAIAAAGCMAACRTRNKKRRRDGRAI